MRNQRRTTVAAICATTALLAGCGSDAEQSIPGPNFATVTGAGQDLNFSADVARNEYPNACRLISDDSMQALVGAPVTSGRTVAGCAWTPGVAALPTVAVQFVELGSDARSSYAARRPGGDAVIRGVPGIDGQARLYTVNDRMTTRVDVLDTRAFFRVEVRIPTTAPQDLTQADQIATRVAQLVSNQISW